MWICSHSLHGSRFLDLRLSFCKNSLIKEFKKRNSLVRSRLTLVPLPSWSVNTCILHPDTPGTVFLIKLFKLHCIPTSVPPPLHWYSRHQFLHRVVSITWHSDFRYYLLVNFTDAAESTVSFFNHSGVNHASVSGSKGRQLYVTVTVYAVALCSVIVLLGLATFFGLAICKARQRQDVVLEPYTLKWYNAMCKRFREMPSFQKKTGNYCQCMRKLPGSVFCDCSPWSGHILWTCDL